MYDSPSCRRRHTKSYDAADIFSTTLYRKQTDAGSWLALDWVLSSSNVQQARSEQEFRRGLRIAKPSWCECTTMRFIKDEDRNTDKRLFADKPVQKQL